MKSFDGLTRNQISAALRYYRIVRRLPPLNPTGDPLLDDVLGRARKMRLTMSNLDDFAKTGS